MPLDGIAGGKLIIEVARVQGHRRTQKGTSSRRRSIIVSFLGTSCTESMGEAAFSKQLRASRGGECCRCSTAARRLSRTHERFPRDLSSQLTSDMAVRMPHAGGSSLSQCLHVSDTNRALVAEGDPRS